MAIVYSYTNLINGKKYIGQTVNPEQRKCTHKSSYQNEKDKEYDSLFHRALRKYGWDNFEYEILAENDNLELINELEIFYIDFYNTKTPNGYNILDGGKNAKKPMKESTKEKLMWSHGKMTQEEVIYLRMAYANKESPKAIYDKYFKERLTYSSFLNIWDGHRYTKVMPEVIQKGRRKKLTDDQVREIKIALSQGEKQTSIAKRYNVDKSIISLIYRNKSYKNIV